MFQLNYRDTRPIYEQIKSGLRRLLVSHAIAADEKLPSVRELAAKLAINPNTIQRAYRELETEGYIYTVPGKGTFASRKEFVQKNRQDNLLCQFDEVVTELLYLSVHAKDLNCRLNHLAERSTSI